MKRKLAVAATMAVVIGLATACATTSGSAGDKKDLPVCKPDFSNMPCRIELPDRRCPFPNTDPTDPFCRQKDPIPHPPLPNPR
jgi:hypothetical protein